MSASGIILLAAFFVGSATFVLWPFIAARWLNVENETPEPLSSVISNAKQLHAEYEALLRAVRDLDFDFQTELVGEEDYRSQREALMQRGIQILEQIDGETAEAA